MFLNLEDLHSPEVICSVSFSRANIDYLKILNYFYFSQNSQFSIFSPLPFVVRFLLLILLYKSGQVLLNSLIISSQSDFDSVSHFIWSNSNPPLVWLTYCKTFETSRNHENLRIVIENLEIILPWEILCT